MEERQVDKNIKVLLEISKGIQDEFTKCIEEKGNYDYGQKLLEKDRALQFAIHFIQEVSKQVV